jgi:hypothetical protein
MHTDLDLLALLALGEVAGSEQEREHVATCPSCTAELAGLQRVVLLARDAGDLTLSEPGPWVWSSLRAELGTRPAGTRSYARLTPVLESWSRATGEAELATDDRGRRLLQLTLDADLPATGLRQAWLVHRQDPRQRQSLGVLDGPHGLWTVPHVIDLEQYAILEVSQQSLGDTTPSGQTIVRGELQAA